MRDKYYPQQADAIAKAALGLPPLVDPTTEQLFLTNTQLLGERTITEPFDPSILNGNGVRHHENGYHQANLLHVIYGPPLSADLMPAREFPANWWKLPGELEKVDGFFDDIAQGRTRPDVMLIVFTQAVDGREETLIRNLVKVYPNIGMLVSKRNNADSKEVARWWEKGHNVVELTRDQAGDPGIMIPLIGQSLAATGTSMFEIFDMGGYTEPSNSAIQEYYGDAFIMSLEDTKSGMPPEGVNYRLGSIADNWNKNHHEDGAVGMRISSNSFMLHYDIPAVAYVNVDGVTREYRRRDIIRNVLTLGLGNIGLGAAIAAEDVFPNLEIFDIDPEVRKKGSEYGFTMLDPEQAVKRRQSADLFISCTGDGGFDFVDEAPDGSEFALATSADVEMRRGLQILHTNYYAVPIDRNITLYISKDNPDHYIWGLNSERATNFAMNPNGNGGKYSADIGPKILPGQGTILALSLWAAENRGRLPNGIIRPSAEMTSFVEDAYLRRWGDSWQKDSRIR